MGCHFYLQGTFPTQGSNPCLLHWQIDFLTTELAEKPFNMCEEKHSGSPTPIFSVKTVFYMLASMAITTFHPGSYDS